MCVALAVIACGGSACTSAEPTPQAKPAAVAQAPAPKAATAPTPPTAVAPVPTEPAPTEPEPTDAPPTPSADTEPEAAPTWPAAPEIPIEAWAPRPHTVAWAQQSGPTELLQLEPQVDAGVIGRVGATWQHVGADGGLAAIELDRDPSSPILGLWPDDAWFVERRDRKLDPEFPEIHELRLMKLRGDRWVPQAYRGDQWWHPGTDDENEPHMSTRTGMLVYPASLTRMERVAGRVDAPDLGLHRGQAVDFVETNKGKIYVISSDEAGVYAQTECENDTCVAAMARRLPAGEWRFGRRVARGKFSVSMLATSAEQSFVLNNVGKRDGWRLDALPTGEQLVGMWASDEGGLWTWNGSALRWRDTDGVWHDVALPEAFEGRSVAISRARDRVWVSGESSGTPAIFTTAATGATP